MKIYIASRFSRAEEMKEVREALKQMGHEVTSRWIDAEQTDANDERRLEQSFAEQAAIDNLEDIAKADLVVSFLGGGKKNRQEKGGRHAEFGAAVALNKWCVVVGEPEHGFHWLPNVERYASTEEWLDSLIENEE